MLDGDFFVYLKGADTGDGLFLGELYTTVGGDALSLHMKIRLIIGLTVNCMRVLLCILMHSVILGNFW